MRNKCVLVYLIWSMSMPALTHAGGFWQQRPDPGQRKYSTLLWEITGKGLKKPSYLFGTMHVSSKMVFHLSDSFYFGIKNAEVVALELDPQLWQDQLFRYQHMQTNLRSYTQGSPNDYLNEKSFQLEKYEDQLKYALSEEPTLINGLLYRTVQPRADFEEDTYLDLYIYQTGKKLGKIATGVENYFETERLILEATQDMMKDKKKSNAATDGESMYDLEKQMQEAYRKGDLDLLDSLELMMQPSKAFMEKFLYRRNEIQANSIDSILKKHSLFVGVGAAHLPGERGLIELLREKGYHLRPISMRDKDALQRDDIDKVKVPVNFSTYVADDGGFKVKLPGKLYKRSDSRSGDSWQYADMSNGSYYMITRVKTHGRMSGQSDDLVLKKIDSLLYENVPGKILSKKSVIRNGYQGLDLINKTRRGDMQRYQIFETPFEIVVFKMSGNGNYIVGKEADQFFNSIVLKPTESSSWSNFEPSRGGFKVKFPQKPFIHLNNSSYESIPRWEYEASDSSTGDAYMIWKKSIQNYRFLEEDSFDLGLMEESFRSSEEVDKLLSRSFGSTGGYACLNAEYLLQDGAYIKTKFIVRGPHYYMLAARSKHQHTSFNRFFDSFQFTPFKYEQSKSYTDTFVNISVKTPIIPDIDGGMRNIIEKGSSEDFLDAVSDYNPYWPKSKTALFQDDSTGEAVYVSVQPFPKYYFPKDSASFWISESNENKIKEDFNLRKKEFFHYSDSVFGVKYIYGDTNCSRLIHNWIFVKGNRLYRVINCTDSLEGQSDFVKEFYGSLRPLDGKMGESVFVNKTDLFFQDLFSRDSLVSKKAKDAISNVYFDPASARLLINAIERWPYNNNDYFLVKSKLINELGYIRGQGSDEVVVAGLKHIYELAQDTSTIQNAVFKALARHNSTAAYRLLKSLLLQDPPVFNTPSDYNILFEEIGDSLALARSLFPELLQLASVDDYKENIRSLMSWLVDSNYMKAADYEKYFTRLLFDARIQLKKQQMKDEKKMQKRADGNSAEDGGGDADEDEDVLEDYSVLLLPFYKEEKTVQDFFNKLLRSRDASLRLHTSILLMRAGMAVPDSIIFALASSDQTRSRLLKSMENIHQEEKFPSMFRNQMDITRSQLAKSFSGDELFSIEYVGNVIAQSKSQRGYVYFFRYKLNKDDDWQMGISGLQPLNLKEASSNDDLVKRTNRKIRNDQPVLEQFNAQLRKLLYSKHKSAASFYLDNDYYIGRGDDD